MDEGRAEAILRVSKGDLVYLITKIEKFLLHQETRPHLERESRKWQGDVKDIEDIEEGYATSTRVSIL